MSNSKIYATSDYKLFKTLRGNRAISELHVGVCNLSKVTEANQNKTSLGFSSYFVSSDYLQSTAKVILYYKLITKITIHMNIKG